MIDYCMALGGAKIDNIIFFPSLPGPFLYVETFPSALLHFLESFAFRSIRQCVLDTGRRVCQNRVS